MGSPKSHRNAHSLLTALPISTPTIAGQPYRLAVVADSTDLQRISGTGPAGKGRSGYKAWAEGLKKKEGDGMVVG